MWEVGGKREWEAASPGRAEQGRSGPGLCPAEGWWTSSLTPTQSLILPNEEERSRSNRSLFILFISLALLPWVFVCECVDRATLQIDKDGKRLKWRLWSSTPKYQTLLIVWSVLSGIMCIFVEFHQEQISWCMCKRWWGSWKKMLLWHFSLCWETLEGSPPFPEVSQSQGQHSLSQLRKGQALKTSGPMVTHIVYIHTQCD